MSIKQQFYRSLAEQDQLDQQMLEKEVEKLQMELDSLRVMFNVWGEKLDTQHIDNGELTIQTLRDFELFAKRAAEQATKVLYSKGKE